MFVQSLPRILQKSRFRGSELEDLLDSASLGTNQLVAPLFVRDHKPKAARTPLFPDFSAVSIEDTVFKVRQLMKMGISSVILFGVPSLRDSIGSDASNRSGIVQRTVRKLKEEFGEELTIITDVCLCQYNLSGQCGLKDLLGDAIGNDITIQSLSEIAKTHAEAGADVVSPSSLMDGQVKSIRTVLDEAGFKKIKIYPYSIKYASSLYSPFRSLAFSEKIMDHVHIDKSSYQIPFMNTRESIREVQNDILEGADMTIIKPAILYLDIIYIIKEKFQFPLAAQNVSGEYAMIKSAGSLNWIDEQAWIISSICSMKRAGADLIISYFCKEIAGILNS
jgi:porphobilinogen synthase